MMKWCNIICHFWSNCSSIFATFKAVQGCSLLNLYFQVESWEMVFVKTFFFPKRLYSSSFSVEFPCQTYLQTKTPHQRGARFWTWALNTSMAQLHPMNNEMRSSTVFVETATTLMNCSSYSREFVPWDVLRWGHDSNLPPKKRRSI